MITHLRYIFYFYFFLLLFKYNFVIVIFFHYILLFLYNIFFITNYLDLICTECNGTIIKIINIIFNIREESIDELMYDTSLHTNITGNNNIQEETTRIIYMKKIELINQTATFVGTNLSRTEILKVASLPKVNHIDANIHYQVLNIANINILENTKKLLNTGWLDIENYKRVCSVTNYFKNSSFNIISKYYICNQIQLKCDLIHKSFPGIMSNLPDHIKISIGRHPVIYGDLDNGSSILCPTTHKSIYENYSIIGVDPRNNKEMHAAPFCLELKTDLCVGVKEKLNNSIVMAYNQYDNEVRSHIESVANTCIDISKIFICRTNLHIPYEYIRINEFDVNNYFNELYVTLNSKTKFEIDHIKEIIKRQK